MKDRQVVELYYRLEYINNVFYSSPPPIVGDINSFHYSLNKDILTIKLKQFCSNIEEARKLVDDFLRSWELDDALLKGRRIIKFNFYDAKIINPNNPNETIIPSTFGIILGLASEIRVGYHFYPNPPNMFNISPDVLTLWQRYEGYLENHEPLSSMAYFCLTLLQWRAGNRKNAAKKYKIDFKILTRLGILTAENKGNEKNARKLKAGKSFSPLTSIEVEWIKAALIAIIRRVGEINQSPSQPVITLNDLPKL